MATENAKTAKAPAKDPVEKVEQVEQVKEKPKLADLVANSRKTFARAKEMKERAQLEEIAKKLKK